jgi:Xaa-Pro dipeptidase
MTHVSPGRVRTALRDAGLDGWLFYYFQKNDPIAERLLGVPAGRLFTRRWFYFIPRKGLPVKIVHRIEPDALDFLPGERRSFLSWRELEETLRLVFRERRAREVAMQYSPRNAVPYLSRVDAGTVELIRSAGVRVVSSGDLVQLFEATLTRRQWERHRRTAADLRRTVFDAFDFIRRAVRSGKAVGERDVQRRILSRYRQVGLISNSPPIVAANENSAAPHYVPSERRSRRIRKGDWVLLDIWAKPAQANAVYADITWCGFVGERVPERHSGIFRIVREARDRALDRVRAALAKGERIAGRDVDRAAREHIARRGFGKYFIHRTGHSIGVEDHANGANMDGLETRETRRLLPGTLFSIEPGIYLKDFGARSEINVFIDGRRAVVSGTPSQKDVLAILSPQGIQGPDQRKASGRS